MVLFCKGVPRWPQSQEPRVHFASSAPVMVHQYPPQVTRRLESCAPSSDRESDRAFAPPAAAVSAGWISRLGSPAGSYTAPSEG